MILGWTKNVLGSIDAKMLHMYVYKNRIRQSEEILCVNDFGRSNWLDYHPAQRISRQFP